MICNSPVRLHSNKYGTVKVWREKKKKKKKKIFGKKKKKKKKKNLI